MLKKRECSDVIKECKLHSKHMRLFETYHASTVFAPPNSRLLKAVQTYEQHL